MMFRAAFGAFGALASQLLLIGCTTIPLDFPKRPTQAVPASSDTHYGAQLNAWRENAGPEMTGSVMLLRGIDALGSRLVMIDRAEASIDAQYFLLKPDAAGNLFLGKLLRAAERGVRVRLLLDDIFTPRNDRVLALLDSHPHIEVRLFNPVSRASPKAWSFLWDFSRVNRRMHNKAFIVDGAVAIMGGRNIAAEYFELKPGQEFDDFEMLAFGEVVPEIAESFDAFWNSRLAVPMEALREADESQRLQQWLTIMDDVISGRQPSPYAAAINSPFVQQVFDGQIAPYVSTADLYYDAPRKLKTSRRDVEQRTLVTNVRERLLEAREEVLIITPYLVPRDMSYPVLSALTERGVRVVIITNSLASTNHIPVHSAYAPRRRELLKLGAELYEIRADKAPKRYRSDAEEERYTLHTKAMIIDREQLLVGSLNLDPRSIEINTEVGLFVNSAEAAEDYREIVKQGLPRYSYRVTLDERGRLRWEYRYGDRAQVYSREPDAGLWRRFKAGVLRLLPIDDQV